MAKAGLWGLTRSLALEGRNLGINVNAIAPIAFTAMSQTSGWRRRRGETAPVTIGPDALTPLAWPPPQLGWCMPTAPSPDRSGVWPAAGSPSSSWA